MSYNPRPFQYVNPSWYQRMVELPRQRSPFGVVAPNGMNLRKSITNPNSRLSRIVNYIRQNGDADKRQVLRNVFNVLVMSKSMQVYDGYKLATRGWGTYVWGLAVEAKILVKTRKGNEVFYSLGPNADKVV